MREFFLPEDAGKQEGKDGRVTPGKTRSRQRSTTHQGPAQLSKSDRRELFSARGAPGSFYLDTHHISGQD